MTVDDLIKKIKLEKHPEGGYYREVYRSQDTFDGVQYGFSGKRNFSTSIYFLLKDDEVSNFHRIKSDEIWHHYTGSSIRIYILNDDGTVEMKTIGKNIIEGETFFAAIPAGTWFCAEVAEEKSFALVGCTVSPGFDFDDFESAERKKLIVEYPQHKDLITRFTKP